MNISIIIPVYNTEKYLRICLDSIINQTYKDFEVILIDDGSTDNSPAICDEYTRKDSRFSVIHKENAGVSEARNDGIAAATGEYIVFIDSDDWLDSMMMELLYDSIRHNNADLAMCNIYDVYSDKDYVPRVKWKEKLLKKDIAYDFVVSNSVTLWNKIFSKKVIKDIRFDKSYRYGEDAVFVAETMKNVNSVALLEECLYYYRNDRVGNVISEPLNNKYLELLYSNYSVYKMSEGNKAYYNAGIQRVYCAVKKILSLTKYHDKASCKQYYTEIKNVVKQLDMRLLQINNWKVIAKLFLLKMCNVSIRLTEKVISIIG